MASEKEYNGFLLEQLERIERILKTAEETRDIDKVIESAKYEVEMIERRLYQDPGKV